ncbi:Integrase catalytic core [Arabidopsis thaliana x Arabidopsis arenosa]|uniref:Integrase catalytic core n=1 Tax=Arabidopsis thaliana x Arabidopsis arenosa TaxID=1240361 RepID=A0A8T1XGD2_9BRAS|nr:Integrase catalytic core [Arabidopsis thaliana x Arabidopsis arenosa]
MDPKSADSMRSDSSAQTSNVIDLEQCLPTDLPSKIQIENLRENSTENLPQNSTSSGQEQPPSPSQVEGRENRNASRSPNRIERPPHNHISLTEQIAWRSADELTELRKMILTLVERSQTQDILNGSLVAQMEQQERQLTNALPEVGRPPQVAFAHTVDRPAPASSSLGNPSARAEVRIALAFPKLPSAPLLPRSYSQPRYTWTRNQMPVSNSHNPGNLPYLRNSTDNLQNSSANSQTPSNNNRCDIPSIRSSNQTRTIDTRNIVDMETFRNYAAKTNANMAQMHSKNRHFRIRDARKLRFREYDVTADPKAHLRAFRLAITRAYLTDEESEAGHCRFFAENLVGHALEWFARNSIDNFDQLATAFLKQYTVLIVNRTSEADLWNLTQLQNEPLRSYIEKFKTTKLKIANLNEEVALAALRNGLWFSSRFREELTVRQPATLDDALHKALHFASEQAAPSPPPAPKKKTTPFPLRLPKFYRSVTEQFSPKRVDFIMGGSQFCRDSANSIKTHQRRVESNATGKIPMQGPDHQITFWESETELDKPHDDALVIRIDVGNCELSRIMVDTRSSVDVLFYDVFKKMGHLDSELQGKKIPLTGFSGETTFSLGTIQLPTIARGVRKLTNFIVVDKVAPFKAILGRPWLHAMKAVPSTYNQCLKFPSNKGVATVYEDTLAERQAARSSDPTQRGPRKALLNQICIDETNPKHCVGIGSDLEPAIREDLISFLKQNKNSFAWDSSNLRGISLESTSHELNVDPTFRPIKQKRRKLGPERAKVVNEEVDRLLKIRSIREVKYPDWLANPVVILMRPDDQEKTAFITNRGTYCYKVMPFGLKNASATYQRLVNKMFADQLGKTMEVYIDDMLVKSAQAKDHVPQLRACFEILNKFGMKLNPEKCSFRVLSGEFLGYIVSERGIKANPKQISTFLEMPSPKTAREVQRLTGRIAALNRFISRSTDKCLPFYQLLRKDRKFEWDHKCEQAFIQLKTYLTEPPILVKPEDGEPLYLYTAISQTAISVVLVREDHERQKHIYYVSKTLLDAETHYPAMEKLALAVVMSARKLRPYFQSHTIVVMTSQPIRSILHSPTQSGRLAKWAIELSEYDIEYRTQTSLKAQVLADFVIELSAMDLKDSNPNKQWYLHVDGSSNRQGSGVGIQLTSPTGEVIEQSFWLGFNASNNESEYKALLAGMRLALGMGIKEIKAHSDSQLVTSQFHGEYEAKDERMVAYLELVKNLSQQFKYFELIRISRGENTSADALAALASTSDPFVKRVIPVEGIENPSIDIATKHADTIPSATCNFTRVTRRTAAAAATSAAAVEQNEEENEAQKEPENESPEDPAPLEPEPYTDWRIPIMEYIEHGTVPPDKWEARKLKAQSARYCVMEGKLMKMSISGPYMTCVYGQQTRDLMTSMHERQCGSLCSGRTLALRIKKQDGTDDVTVTRDDRWQQVASADSGSKLAKLWLQAWLLEPQASQTRSVFVLRYGRLSSRVDSEPMISSAICTFGYVRVRTDTSGYVRYVRLRSDTSGYARLRTDTPGEGHYRHGIPYEIVTDNGTNFTSVKVQAFCDKWKIHLTTLTPRYPQGNGQAEPANKTILSNIKKRLDSRKSLWSDKLPGVLWAHRTTPRKSTKETPFSLAYGLEAVIPAETSVTSVQRMTCPNNPDLNDQMLQDNMDLIEERRDQAMIRVQNYKQAAARFYNSKIKIRRFSVGELVLRKVFSNTKEPNAGKLGTNWEGPYRITEIVRDGVYKLEKVINGVPELRSWNAMHLKKYYY